LNLDKLELAILVACLIWSTWPVLAGTVDRWNHDPRYSHGYLVPIFALALLWMRRTQLRDAAAAPWGRWWGISLLLLGMVLQLVGGYFYAPPLAGLAVLPYLGGICALVAGVNSLRWALPSILFLVFMLPLPYRIETALSQPLQQIATLASTYVLKLLGLMAFAEGNVILLNDARIGVVEACSGLSMLITFTALTTATALVVHRPLSDRIVLVASAVPIAIVSNVARIVFTGILHETAGGGVANWFYHDLAGWLMIPFALGLIWLEVWVIDHLLVEVEPISSVTVVTGLPGVAAGVDAHLPAREPESRGRGKTLSKRIHPSAGLERKPARS
jgi:exosortase